MGAQSENSVTADIVHFLLQRGWRPDRVQVGVFLTPDGRKIAIGRRGQPDWRFIHPRYGYQEVEMKATGKKPSREQAEYIATAHAMGFKCTWADSLEMYRAWYQDAFGDYRP